MTPLMTRFGLRHILSRELVGFFTTSNEGGQFCSAVAYELDTQTGNVWLVEDRETAEIVSCRRGEWFNAGYENPINQFQPDDLEIVEVALVVVR